MTGYEQIGVIIRNSPSVDLLKTKNRELITSFFIEAFSLELAISSEKIHYKLASYLEKLEEQNIGFDEEIEEVAISTYEEKAKKYIQLWTDKKGFLTNYQNEAGEIFYELSSHSSKTIDWLASLRKEEYIGTESKFKTIFNQLKDLVEFTSEDKEKRLQLLEDKKLEIERQIQSLKMGENIKVFDEYEIVPRFSSLNKLAKELLSDFKEVDENFKRIIKDIYQKQTDVSLKKGAILQYTFDALDQLKNSSQGKSFYAFWEFLGSQELQQEWEKLTQTLYQALEDKNIATNDVFLKDMNRHLFDSGQKVYQTNDKMAKKLSRIIRESEIPKTEATRNIIQEIKKLLLEISKKEIKQEYSFEVEEIELNLPFERKLTYEQTKEVIYSNKPQIFETNFDDLGEFSKLYNPYAIDKNELRQNVKNILKEKTQTTILDTVESYGGISKGLSEVFGYIGIAKDFKYTINVDKTQDILFDKENRKIIQIPEIILTM